MGQLVLGITPDTWDNSTLHREFRGEMPSHPKPRAGRAGRMFVKLETTTPGMGGQLTGGCTVAQHLAPPHGPVLVTTTPPCGPRMTGRPQHLR